MYGMVVGSINKNEQRKVKMKNLKEKKTDPTAYLATGDLLIPFWFARAEFQEIII